MRPIFLILHLISFFIYAVLNNILRILLKKILYNKSKLIICWVCMVCLTTKIKDPNLLLISCLIIIALRLTYTYFLSILLTKKGSKYLIINELMYMSYELDILYLTLAPFTITITKSPVSYYFGHADYFFWFETLYSLNSLILFSLFCILGMFFHIRSGFFRIRDLMIRLVLSLCSLALYIYFFSYFY